MDDIVRFGHHFDEQCTFVSKMDRWTLLWGDFVLRWGKGVWGARVCCQVLHDDVVSYALGFSGRSSICLNRTSDTSSRKTVRCVCTFSCASAILLR